MPTDEQLARDLGAAFRAATDDLTYAGRVPHPSRVRPAALVAVPLAAAGVAVAVAAHPTADTRGTPSASGPTVSASPTGAPVHVPSAAPVTRTLTLAGYAFTYTQAAGSQPLYGTFVSAVPAGAEPVQTSGLAKDYVGVDPANGQNTAWVDAGGRVLAITSRDATRAELVALLQGPPTPIPAVG